MRVDLLPVDGSGLFTQLSSFRVEIDPTSNPSPQGGLLVPAPSNTQFNIPLLTSNGPGFQLCEAYVDDPANDYDFSQISSGIVKFNRSGYFELGFNIYIISSAIETDGTIAMILKNGQAIFGTPPSCSNTRTSSDTYSALPGFYVKNLNASANTKISAGDEIVLAIITNNVTPGNDISLQACTNLFCTRLSSNSVLGSGSGSVYDSNLENTGAGTQILANPGVFPSTVQRNFKSLLAGTNVSFVDSGTDITINASSSVPNSDLQSLGAGNAILATTGSLPVTTTRNFKTLIAGSNITLTPTANDITIAATGATDTNIYNTSGSLTANRTFGFNNFNLTMNGTGNYLLNNTGTIGLGNASSTTVTIGRSSQTLALNSGTITATNLPNTTQTNVVGFDSASKQLTYFAATSLPNPNTGVYFSVLPSSNVALALGDNFITGLIDASANRCYNDGSINTGTGVWSMSFPQYVSVSIQLTLTSSNASYITPEYFSYGLYNIGTGNKDVSSHNFITTNSGSGQTFTFSNHFYFPGTQTYKFFINVSNITGTLSVYYPETRFAIQRY